jgi:hypothetical protein
MGPSRSGVSSWRRRGFLSPLCTPAARRWAALLSSMMWCLKRGWKPKEPTNCEPSVLWNWVETTLSSFSVDSVDLPQVVVTTTRRLISTARNYKHWCLDPSYPWGLPVMEWNVKDFFQALQVTLVLSPEWTAQIREWTCAHGKITHRW